METKPSWASAHATEARGLLTDMEQGEFRNNFPIAPKGVSSRNKKGREGGRKREMEGGKKREKGRKETKKGGREEGRKPNTEERE